MLVYAAATEVSAARMFMAGFIPGIMMGLMLMIVIFFVAKIKRSHVSRGLDLRRSR